jgi:hypothetical protein
VQFLTFTLRVFVFFALSSAAFAAEPAKVRRVALIIGNHRYEAGIGPLRNPDNDAKAMARALRSLGFAVIEKHNVSRDELMSVLLKFSQQLRGAEVGLFYYAGHGISVAGANYLLPIRSRYDPAAAVDGQGRRLLAETLLFNAEQAVAVMSASGAACNLVILDACRNTPASRDPASRGATGNGGLSEMNPPAGSLVAFATDAGKTAEDGSGSNGLYTDELIKHLLTPGLSIEQVFKRTRAGVMRRSGGAQIPAEYSRLVGDDVVLLPVASAKPDAEPAPPRVASWAEIQKLAVAGDLERCVMELRLRGPDGQSVPILSSLLDRLKEYLRDPNVAKLRAQSLLDSCDELVDAVDSCVPAMHPLRVSMLAKAHNRRGDILLLLERPMEARTEFDAAAILAPDDGYIVYNRGRAFLALGKEEDAKADFTTAASARFKKSGVRKLASAALAEMK